MAMTSFTVEGDAVLGYHADAPWDRDRVVMIKDDDSEDAVRIEQLIAKNLNFPNSDEFDQHSARMQELAGQGLQPMDDENPDIVRETVRLRVTVEVVEPGDDD